MHACEYCMYWTVPGEVVSVTVSERGSHHLVLEWNAPDEPNGVILTYTVAYRQGHYT